MNAIVDVIIPAFNEEKAICAVVNEIPRNIVRNIIVVDNRSTDNTYEKATQCGAIVISEPQKGYGAACLKGIEFAKNQSSLADILVFLDGDHSDYPEQMSELLQPILEHQYDMVIGSRANQMRESGSMTPQQVFGNWLATTLIQVLFRHRYTDLGPFRAIKFSALQQLNMQDRNYGWTVEMQIKAIKQRLKITEVPMKYRKRIGISKVSGTIKGTFMAGYKILYTIFKYGV